MPYRTRGSSLIFRCRVFCVIIFVLLSAMACGRGVDDSGDAIPAPASPTVEPVPNSTLLEIYRRDTPELTEYIEECRRLNREPEEAAVVYNDTEYMRRGDPQTIEAAITLRVEVPPRTILESEGATSRPVLVSCTVEAELRAAKAEFEIQEEGWQTQSLLTSPTVRWAWSVTPKRGGNHDIVLAIRPVIALDDKTLQHGGLEASTELYRIKIEVSTPLDERIADGLERVASLFASVQGVVVALTTLVGAILALRFAIRRKQAKSLPHTDSDPPS